MRPPSAITLSTFLIAVLFAIPVVTVVAHLFFPATDTWAHMVDTVLPLYIRNSLWLMIAVGAGTLVIGTSTAWLVSMCRFPLRTRFEWALILPLAVPSYVIAYAYTDFFQFAGPLQSAIRELMGWSAGEFRLPNIRSLGGAMIIFTLVLFPYVYLIARTAFLQQSACVLEVSRSLGASPRQAFFRVALPLARPALVAGMALALMETLADFGAVSYFGVPTFTTGIYRAWFSMGDKVAAAQLSTLLLGFVALLLALESWSRRARRYHHTTGHYRRLKRFDLTGWRAAGAVLACGLPVFLGFLLPALILASLAIGAGEGQITARYLGLVRNTLTLGLLTASLAVPVALLVAYALRRRGGMAVKAAGRVAGLGYAIPGSIIAVGVLIPFAAFDNLLDGFARTSFGFSTGLLLTGSIAALVFAYLVRFLSVALQTTDSGLQKITPSMDAAAATLGAGPGRTLMRVHVPLLKGSLLTAFLLVLVDVMKELPATLIMRPFNFDTLAVQAHNLASDERLAQAALPALTIVMVGLIPVIALSQFVARSRPGGEEAEVIDGGIERVTLA